MAIHASTVLTVATMAALALTGAMTGALGALVGIGGGVLLVPALVLVFHVAPHAAVAASLVAVVATSTAAGSVYVGSGLVNMRLGMSLEIATALGGFAGGLIAAHLSATTLAAALALLLLTTAGLLGFGRDAPEQRRGGSGATASHESHESRSHLGGTYYDAHEKRAVVYRARRWPLGAAVSLVAGAASGLFGVGGGFLKVPAMTLGMGVPIRVAAATSNFMIGVTAVSSLAVYLTRGFVEPLLAAPATLGVVAGSLAATRVVGRVPRRGLRWLTGAVLVFAAMELGWKAIGHHAAG
jgi:uncharacterized protein